MPSSWMEAIPFVIGAIPFVGGPFKGDLQRPGKNLLVSRHGLAGGAVRHGLFDDITQTLGT